MAIKPASFVISPGDLLDCDQATKLHVYKMKQLKESLLGVLETIFNEHTFAGKDGLLHSMDAPHCNDPMPTWTRPAAVAIYFGKNKRLVDTRTVWRAAYGTGTGTSSIGRDPRDFCVMQFGLPLQCAVLNMKECVVDRTRRKSNKHKKCIDDEELITQIASTSYNFLEMKVYLKGKKLGAHCDVLYKKDGTLCAGNSQAENTPVLVYSLGCTRILVMERQECEYDSTNHRCSAWKNTGDNTLFELAKGSIFVLVPADEKPTRSGNKIYRFRHSVQEVKKNVSIAFVFRAVTAEVKVDITTGKKRDLSEREEHYIKRKKFDDAKTKIWTIKEKGKVQEHIQSMLEREKLIYSRNDKALLELRKVQEKVREMMHILVLIRAAQCKVQVLQAERQSLSVYNNIKNPDLQKEKEKVRVMTKKLILIRVEQRKIQFLQSKGESLSVRKYMQIQKLQK